jgi:23S rRNA (guanosine2251-2'-O)-methyltransferase
MSETLYGRQAVREALRAGRRRPLRLFTAESTVDVPIITEIIKLAKQQRIPHKMLPRHDMVRVAKTEDHQGIALETSPYPYSTTDDMLALAQKCAEPPLLLILDLIQDVHNLGSLIRTAEAAGVHGIILQERRAAGITPVAVNTSSGATEHLHIARVTNLARTIQSLKDADIWIAGLEGTADAEPYTCVNMTGPLGIVVGSEGQGLRRLVRKHCDWLIAMPMRGKINSLNAAIAGSIALYEALRQRGAAKAS